MTDILLETVRVFVLLGICVYLWHAGRRRFQRFRNGWNLILGGFWLLLFGSVLDLSDNFEGLKFLVVVGDTEIEAILEKFVGFLGGFLLLAFGLLQWIPRVQSLSELVDIRTRDLQEINRQLTSEIDERKTGGTGEGRFRFHRQPRTADAADLDQGIPRADPVGRGRRAHGGNGVDGRHRVSERGSG